MERPVQQEPPVARAEGRGKGRLSLRPGGSTSNPFRVTSPGMKGWQLPGGKGGHGQAGRTPGGKGAASAAESGWTVVARAPPTKPDASSAEAMDLMREKQMERVEQMRQRREREELEAEEGGPPTTFADIARGGRGAARGAGSGGTTKPGLAGVRMLQAALAPTYDPRPSSQNPACTPTPREATGSASASHPRSDGRTTA